MSLWKSFVFITTAAVMGSGALASAQETATARSEREQAIYASVLNKEGHPVTTLKASDFVVREGGVVREVTAVATAAEPVRIAVLADTSRAMQPYINDMRHALRSFFKQMEGNAEIALFEFGDRSTRLVDYTSDQTQLEAGIGRLFARPTSGSYVLDAIVEAARDFRMRESARPVIVVISAQGPEFSQRYHQNVLKDLRESHATLHSIVVTRRRLPILRDDVRERELTFTEGATLTGGRREDLLTSMSLGDTLTSLARELKDQYRVAYLRPDGLIPPDRVDVGVRQPRLTVRATHVPQATPRRLR
jgi:VWFA-related protein